MLSRQVDIARISLKPVSNDGLGGGKIARQAEYAAQPGMDRGRGFLAISRDDARQRPIALGQSSCAVAISACWAAKSISPGAPREPIPNSGFRGGKMPDSLNTGQAGINICRRHFAARPR